MMSYDPRCYDLAEVFLLDEPAAAGPLFKVYAGILAQLIQDTIEDHIQFTLRNYSVKTEQGRTLVEQVVEIAERGKGAQRDKTEKEARIINNFRICNSIESVETKRGG